MIPRETYEIANGHSNLYWGWGGEDGDIGWRVHYSMGGNYLLYPKDGLGRYKMMEHLHPWTNFPKPPAGDNILDVVNDYVAASTGVLKVHRTLRQRYDGLSTINYIIKEKIFNPAYTKYIFEIRKMALDEVEIKFDDKTVMQRYPDQELHEQCKLVKFEKACSVEDKFVNSQYTADKVNCSGPITAMDWCDKYDDKCLAVFYNGEQGHVDTVLFKLESRKSKRDMKVAYSKYNNNKIGTAEKMFIKRSNYTDEKDTDNYLEYSLGTTCSIQLIPQPLRSCQKPEHKSFFHLKDCPGRQGLFQIKHEVHRLNFGSAGHDLRVNFRYVGRILQPSDGLVTYRDTVLYEGRRISSANLPVDLMKEKVEGLDLDVAISAFGATEGHKVIVEWPDEEEVLSESGKKDRKVIVHISFIIKKALPGFYTFNSKLMDDFFQPYVEFNSVFRLESDIEDDHKRNEKDEYLRKMFSHTLFEQSAMDNNDLLRWRNRARINLLALRKAQFGKNGSESKREDTYIDPIPVQQAKLEHKSKQNEEALLNSKLQDEMFESKLLEKAKIKAEKKFLDWKKDPSVLTEIMTEMRLTYNDLKKENMKTIEDRFSQEVDDFISEGEETDVNGK